MKKTNRQKKRHWQISRWTDRQINRQQNDPEIYKMMNMFDENEARFDENEFIVSLPKVFISTNAI